MADDHSEEFKKFILENREIIESILDEAKRSTKKASEEIIGGKVEEAKDKTKEFNDAVFRIISDDDVQRHFISGCLEFLHFFESVIEAAPLPPEVRDVVDKFEETKEKAVRNVVVTGAKDRMEKVSVDDSKPKSGKKKGYENIKVNDLSKKK